ncbi:mitochondrial glyco protein [Eremomyces bilateralis CBS 781.70]|uniref:Mitochondrial glyco protein n=1 Tax=Eremomyces bilateralis CBS 781.70 TaxID=1392243 RepID=A0A6G1GIA8_9PEZI|nr:mitochondrial glyco protein [Eremomyces bilateralis CBS 781.70]KAF1817619.1 mitochondrial glyco protein [Eremomyces bilateralis CBS 781.70]
MLSMRLVARASPRAFAQQCLRTSRQVASPLRLSAVQTAWRQPTTTRLASAFSTSSRCFQNDELVAKLRSEISLENEATDTETYKSGIKEFLESTQFNLHDTPGQEEVVLTKKYNNENIRVSFSIADINNAQPTEEPYDEDNALYDEDGAETSEYAQESRSNKGAINSSTRSGPASTAPEDRLAPADREELDEDDFEGEEGQDVTFPCQVNIQVTRDGHPGALDIAAVADSGDLVIENVAYFPSGEVAEGATSEMRNKRRGLYSGPPFGNLDVELQTMMEKYLEERGVGVQMAMFVPEYVDYKEQKEYVRWLENVEQFMK